MAETGTPATIVVGFDGSQGSSQALKWAAQEAGRRGAELVVAQAWTPGEFGTDAERGAIIEERMEKEVAAALGDTAVRWRAVAERGSAARVLMSLAKDAEMLVVGSRGHGTLTGVMLGSVGIQIATHSGAPVVAIVRTRTE